MSEPQGRSLSFLRKTLVAIAQHKTVEVPTRPPNWNEVLHFARLQSLEPSLYSALCNAPDVPPPLIDALREHSVGAFAKAEFAWDVLAGLAPDLSAAGRCVILQGLALLETVYPTDTARFLGDIDLFLEGADWDRVTKTLEANGFQPWLNYTTVWIREGLTLDLHASLWGEERIPGRRFILPGYPNRFRPSKRCPGLFLLPPEWMRVHTTYHMVKHGFSRLIWDLDLLLLDQGDGSVSGASVLAGKLAGLAQYRTEALREIAPPRSDSFGETQWYVLKHVMAGAGRPLWGEIGLAMLAPNLWKAFLYLLGSLFPPKRVLREMYGPHGSFILYLRRFGSFVSLGAESR